MASDHEVALFLEALWGYYNQHGRHDLPWRQVTDGRLDPYLIMVSELMLQQTQVSRVIPKYEQFLRAFPTFPDLAAAELGDVLRVWQGLGYNRRAKFLWRAAQEVTRLPAFPAEQAELVRLPGIGPNTAGAIQAYAFNQPVVYVETNIRTVYIYHFFRDELNVSDKLIREVVERTLDRKHPREFYWALMDYGTNLKATVGSLNSQSKHYVKQSAFQGSKRQVRGHVIRLLGTGPRPLSALQHDISDERLVGVLSELVDEGLVRVDRGVYSL